LMKEPSINDQAFDNTINLIFFVMLRSDCMASLQMNSHGLGILGTVLFCAQRRIIQLGCDIRSINDTCIE
ncbi:MAG: hypothetical protein QF872_02600, partial [Gammaproteobacteria bacterium]|nr:hypothetical protein [Gammaproteobacteria bacterium]